MSIEAAAFEVAVNGARWDARFCLVGLGWVEGIGCFGWVEHWRRVRGDGWLGWRP